ncbi:peptidoglycan-binding domain-containing protein [Ilumatobacter coccineus]|uniref:Peptidoglycan binding-like domain-containing protein n=1 Tax=Ilumatobacter coccineus (strain NBRC 103263 / KCTC 29153 / YM16-304) TaxID=1313172 RepID=A0A6C7EC05_ILUCY|nr:peptidoglycan-binding domain-containing protein [Ilumatobacter coccineus]BAN03532.1 hypothetical protein YM304_32180 [Ilumatobacter coccineus YM16-304]
MSIKETSLGRDLDGDARGRSVETDADGASPSRTPAADRSVESVDHAVVGVRSRRSWPWLVVGAGLGVAATFAVQSLTSDGADDAAIATTEVVELATAEATSRDLVDYIDYEGQLTRGATTSVLATASGTITESVPVGSELVRGAHVVSIDGSPVVTFYGSLPFHRSLDWGDEGADVEQLEANLWALGFTDDATLSVDGVYDTSTADAVEAWETSLGLEATGDFDAGRVIVVDGPSLVAEIAAPGSSSTVGQQLLLAETTEARWDVTLDAGKLDDDAVIADLVEVGTPVVHGTILATLDGQSVVAVTDVSDVTAALLEAFADDDLELLERLLVFFGFDPDGAITIDDDADLATVAGIVRWQEAAGIPATGAVGAQYYVVVPSGFEVVEVISADGDPIGNGALAASLGSSTISVTTDIVVDEIDDIDVGDPADVVLADDEVLTARVESIADAADDTGDGTTPTIAVRLTLDAEPDDVVVGPVTVRFESSRVTAATVVPTRALVSLREGGFAVEIRSDDGTTRLVGVELGAFDDGVVEVVAGEVAPGDDVVVPT